MNPFLFLLLIIAISCEDNDKVYKVSGTVYSIDINKQKAMIAHDTIPNLMMPMTMPFYIQNKKDLTKIKIGDSVHFELLWEEIKPYARNFTILGKGFIPQDDEFFSDEFSEKNIGSVLDDASFLNLDSIRVNLSQTDGEYRFISYVFSRCPMPNLCPAIVLKNAALVNQFSKINFIPSIIDSFIIAIGSASWTLFIAIYSGYYLSRNNFKFKNLFIISIISARMMPLISISIPIYFVFSKLNLLDNYFGLILVHSFINLPLAVLLMKSFYDDIPKEIDENAFIDGAKKFHILHN